VRWLTGVCRHGNCRLGSEWLSLANRMLLMPQTTPVRKRKAPIGRAVLGPGVRQRRPGLVKSLSYFWRHSTRRGAHDRTTLELNPLLLPWSSSPHGTRCRAKGSGAVKP
jgi:hypothetical protein